MNRCTKDHKCHSTAPKSQSLFTFTPPSLSLFFPLVKTLLNIGDHVSLQLTVFCCFKQFFTFLLPLFVVYILPCIILTPQIGFTCFQYSRWVLKSSNLLCRSQRLVPVVFFYIVSSAFFVVCIILRISPNNVMLLRRIKKKVSFLHCCILS